MKPEKTIPVCEPDISAKELEYVNSAVSSGWISSAGPFIEKFETQFAKYLDVDYATTCSNGTTALHLALLALDIKPGDEVIIPNFTMVACLFAVLYVGAKPVFVDAAKDTWCIDPKLIEAKITKKTKAIMAVHIYGHPADMTAINKLAKKYNLKVIEDSAEAHGATIGNKKTGTFSDIACFSFYSNKIITTGEGGMVVSDSEELIKKVRYYKNLCFSIDGPRDFLHHDLGYNYRMTNTQAAIGVAQVERAEELVNKRRQMGQRYNSLLKSIPGITLPIELAGYTNVYWMYGVVIDPKKFGVNRDVLMEKLKQAGIETRYFFKPMSQQPVLKNYQLKDKATYPVTQWLSDNGLYLPSSPNLTVTEQTYIADTIKRFTAVK